jgi:PAS domain S-box-containing protein
VYVPTAVFAAVCIVVYLWSLSRITSHFIATVDQQRRASLKQMVDVARNEIEPIVAAVREGRQAKGEGLTRVRQLVRRMTYHDQYGPNYIFMSAYDGTMLVQPFEPEKELTSQWDLQDVHGRYIIRELVRVARSDPAGGFVSYDYYPPRATELQEKLAFVVGIPELECYIGTGMYTQQAYIDLASIIRRVQLLSLVLVALTVGSALVSMRQIARRNRQLAREVLERQRAEATIRESERRFHAIFNQAFHLAGVLDPAGTVIHVNSWALDFAGVQEADVLGRPAWESPWWRADEAEQARVKEAVRRATEEGLPSRFETCHIDKEGRRRAIDFSLRPVKDEAGRVLLLVPEGVDITERKQAKQERARLAEQLLQAQKLESLGRLAGGVAHDLNNVLSPVLGYAELLLDDLGEEHRNRAEVESILAAATRARDLTQQLLAFARKQTLEVKPLDLNQSIQDLVRMVARTLRADIRLELELGHCGAIVADPGQLGQVLLNLLLNAQDAMQNGGVLRVETGETEVTDPSVAEHLGIKPGRYVFLSVSDTGAGMDKAVLERLFEPFFTTKELGKGTGLGLSTVYGIVRQHGGGIGVESQVERGTTFRVYFPSTGQMPEPEPGVPESERCFQGHETILVADDQEQVRGLVCGMLKRYGYTVLEAENGTQALEAAQSLPGTIDLLLTDVMMPDMDGRTLHQRLSSSRSSLKVVYISGYGADIIASDGVLDADIDFVAKPFTVQTLMSKVRMVLDRKESR